VSDASSGTACSYTSDDTYTGRSPTPAWGTARKKGRKVIRRGRDVDSTTKVRGQESVEARAVERSKELRSNGTAQTAQTSDSSEVKMDEVDDSNSDQDEYAGPYRGPHLHVISVEWISDRLDRSFYKYRMTVEHLGQWAAWWPRTKVAQHHRLDSAGVWLLTMGVHKWWSDLFDELNSPDVKWPEGLDEIGQEDITMKVEEIMLAKESAMVAANRLMLKNGEAISIDSVLHLRHGRR